MLRTVLRNTQLKGFVRHNSTTVTQSDIDALLARVMDLNLPQNRTAANPRFSEPSARKKKNKPHAGHAASANSKKAAAKQPSEKVQNAAQGITQAKHKKFNNLTEFDQVASKFTEEQKPAHQKVRVRTRDRRSVNRDATATSQSGKPQGQRARGARGKGASNNRGSRKRDEDSMPTVNPNIELFNDSYIPQPPTLATLLENSPFTAQTPTSRILKAYNELHANKDADVSGILTGKSHCAPYNVLDKMSTSQLKLNAEVVVNSLNKNSCFDYDTKMKLLGPLTGLAPVKQLSA